MLYFLLVGIALTMAMKRNPVTLVRLRFRYASVIIGSLAVQVVLWFLTALGVELPAVVFICTFVGVLIGLALNQQYAGVRLILIGAFLNLCAIVVFGGAMPVSASAMHIAGLPVDALSGSGDSRHQLLNASAFLWLGDWIPVPKHVLSPGDVFVGIGLIRFMAANSAKRDPV